jgi:hypothetical protein
LLVEDGKAVPPNLLALIPDDCQAMDDKSRFVGKADLLNSIGRRPMRNIGSAPRI